MDFPSGRQTREIMRFVRFHRGAEDVEETVENLCFNSGERWKTTQM